MRPLCQTQHELTQGRHWTKYSKHTVDIHNANENVHFWLCNSLDSACPVTVRLNGRENGFGASGRRRACPGGVVVHSQAHGYNLCFHLPDRGEDIRMQWIGDTITLESGNENFFHIVTAVYEYCSTRVVPEMMK
jgi:hypothetical protein